MLPKVGKYCICCILQPFPFCNTYTEQVIFFRVSKETFLMTFLRYVVGILLSPLSPPLSSERILLENIDVPVYPPDVQ